MVNLKSGQIPIITFNNAKGGVAKTSSLYNIATILSNMGVRTLIIDGDPQSNLTLSAGIEPDSISCSLAQVLTSYAGQNKVKIEEAILQLNEKLYIVCSQLELSTLDAIGSALWSREFILARSLESVIQSKFFDCILIDNQPSLSLLPLNSLACSTHVIIPCSTQYLAYRGLTLLEDTIKLVQENLNEELEIAYILPTMYDGTTHAKEILNLLNERYGDKVLPVVPKSVKLTDAIYSSTGSVSDYAPKSKPAIAYKHIAEIIYKDFRLAEIVKRREEMEANNNGK